MKEDNGFTLIEILVAMGISAIIALGAVWLLISSLRSGSVVWDQLSGQSDGRRGLKVIVNDVRRAQTSSIGAYPIETATTNTLVLYANIDTDGYVERVHYYLDGTTLRRGIIKPSGTPLQYLTASEQFTDVAHYIENTRTGLPLFQYYNESYAGTSTPLVDPVLIMQVHVVRMQLDIERDPTKSPVPLRVESVAQVRNLKTN